MKKFPLPHKGSLRGKKPKQQYLKLLKLFEQLCTFFLHLSHTTNLFYQLKTMDNYTQETKDVVDERFKMNVGVLRTPTYLWLSNTLCRNKQHL